MPPQTSKLKHHEVPPLARNFPLSTASPSVIHRFPGISPESTEVARKVLTENNHKYDIFESARYAHNHFPHSLLTRYALGAPARLLQDVWDHDKQHLVSLDPKAEDRETDMGKVPERITRDNWDKPEYLGFDGAYSRYLAFFHEEIDRIGPVETLKEYAFSARANWEGRQPRMLLRLHGGFDHPFIHAGFGIEFRDRILIAEGLAEACIHKVDLFDNLFPSDYPKNILSSSSSSSSSSSPAKPNPPLDQQWDAFSSAPSSSIGHTPSSYPGKSLLEIYAIIQFHPDLTPSPYNPDSLMRDRVLGAAEGDKGKIIWDIAEQWSLTDKELQDGPGGWVDKVGELGMLATLLACATGREGREDRVDFFLMHALTSSMFLPSYLPLLSIPQRRALLRTYSLVTIQTALSRGRPHLKPDLLMAHTEFPVAPHTASDRAKDGEVSSDPADKETRNAWLSLVESCLYAHDSHCPKSIRSLLYHSTHYSHTPPGGFKGSYIPSSDGKSQVESIKGMGKVDGTVWIRAAGMIMDLQGWVREGEEEGNWDFSALGYDEAWEKKEGQDQKK